MEKSAKGPTPCFRALQMLPENVKNIGIRMFSYIGFPKLSRFLKVFLYRQIQTFSFPEGIQDS